MAKLDLTSEQWCELVFEGRNKDYGAYYLRRSSSVRHNKAMLIVMVVAVVCITLPYLIKAVMPVQQTKEVITEVTTLSQLPPPEVKSEAVSYTHLDVYKRQDERLCPCPAKCLYDGRCKKDGRADAVCGPWGDFS